MAYQEGIEGIKTRLSNISSVEPILGAMRTIALGSWQAALNRQNCVRRYSQRLASLLPLLLPHLAGSYPGRRRRKGDTLPPAPVLVLIIGSERGLCGAFNSTLIRHVEEILDQYEARDTQTELATLGSRAKRALERTGRTAASKPLPMTTLPTNELAQELIQGWFTRYRERELDAVDIIYNAYRSSTLHEPISVRLIPPTLPDLISRPMPWPPPYIDTDPIKLCTRLVRLWATTEMYRILLDSAAAEHSARFRLMEGATRNSSRLIDELTLALQSARQQAITSEMRELATGAGLIGGQEA